MQLGADVTGFDESFIDKIWRVTPEPGDICKQRFLDRKSKPEVVAKELGFNHLISVHFED